MLVASAALAETLFPSNYMAMLTTWQEIVGCFFSCAQTASHQSASKLKELIPEVEQFQCVYAAEPRMMSFEPINWEARPWTGTGLLGFLLALRSSLSLAISANRLIGPIQSVV